MGAFLVYSIEIAVTMSVLYLGYKLLLSSATFYRFNRFVILSIYAMSILMPAALPFLRFSTQKTAVETGFPMAVAITDNAPVSEFKAETVLTDQYHVSIDWTSLIADIYLLGFMACLAITVAAFLKMMRIFSNGAPLPGQEGNKVLVSEKAISSFSWGGKIVISPQDTDSDLPRVIAHEQAHLEKLHWIDLLFAQIVIIFQWFSPASYLLMRELKMVHEFEVDEKVSAGNPYSYQMMLIKKAAGSSFPTFADSLNSQLKIRITMMLSKRSNGKRRFAAAALLPMAATSAFVLSQPAVAGILANLDPAVSDSEFNHFPAIPQAGQADLPTDNSAKHEDAPEKMTVENADATASDGISAGVVTDKAENPGIGMDDEKGPKKHSKIKYILDGKPFEGTLEDLNPTDIESVTMKNPTKEYPYGYVEILTKEYAKKNNIVRTIQPVKVSENNGREIYVATEKMPEFPGGQEALRKFLYDNLKYSDNNNESARVIVKFIINKNGDTEDPVILKSGGEALDKEASRLILALPKWTPAEVNGKPVDSYFTIPVVFRSKDNDQKKKESK